MFEIVGGILSIVIGIVMLLIGSSIISQITTSGTIGDCNSLKVGGVSTGADTPASKACQQTVNSGYTVIQIMSVMLIVGGVLISIRGYF